MGQADNIKDGSQTDDQPSDDSRSRRDLEHEEDNPNERDLIEYIPEKRREELIRSLVLREEYSGPIAHPRITSGYEQILPGSADRILIMAEEQQHHRLKLEDRGQQAAIQRDRRAAYLGFLLGVGLLLLAAYAIASNYPLASVGFVGLAVATLGGAFYVGQRKTQLELTAKRESLDNPSVPPAIAYWRKRRRGLTLQSRRSLSERRSNRYCFGLHH